MEENYAFRVLDSTAPLEGGYCRCERGPRVSELSTSPIRLPTAQVPTPHVVNLGCDALVIYQVACQLYFLHATYIDAINCFFIYIRWRTALCDEQNFCRNSYSAAMLPHDFICMTLNFNGIVAATSSKTIPPSGANAASIWTGQSLDKSKTFGQIKYSDDRSLHGTRQ